MIDAIVSGIRVTPIDDLAETYGIGERTVRDTFLEYRPGNPGLQRRDLRIDRIRQTARRWWPDVDGQTTYPPRTERRESDE